MTFYENYLRLCEKVNRTPSAAALEMGLSKTTVNRWKNGGGLTDATALKVSAYFGVTVDELKGEVPQAQKEKPSALEVDGLDVLYKECEGLSVDEIEEARRYIAYLKAKRNGI